MNRINQQLGQIKWYADQLQLLQVEPIKAIDLLFAHFPSCVISGCEVDGTTVKSGLISFTWTDAGTKKSMIVPFDGAASVSFPKYFVLEKTDVMRYYENGGSKVFSESYKAILSDSVPGTGPYFQIQSDGTTVRLLDAIQSALYRLVTDTEKTTWNNKLNASSYTAADVLSKLLTVDGAGTGLDADLLDGQHANVFALLAGAAFTGNVSTTGYLSASTGLRINITAINGTVAPLNSGYPEGLSYMNVSSSQSGWPSTNGSLINYKNGSQAWQIFFEYGGNYKVWERHKTDSADTWENWYEISGKADIVSISSSTSLNKSHHNKIIEATNNITITLPNSMPVGMKLDIINIGTGIITIVASGTLTSKNSGNKLATRYGGASIYHAGSNVWRAVGDLTT